MDRLFEVFDNAGHELWLVGGAVRDHLLGLPWKAIRDYDFATDAPVTKSGKLLRRAGLSVFPVGSQWGTVGGLLRGPKQEGYPREIQVTTFRPSVEDEAAGAEVGASLDDDLGRRDFTINAIVMGRGLDRGAIIDPFGGHDDLAASLIRAVGDPERMLRDDPLRLLRIGRFVAALGFEVDAALLAVARARATSILDVSRERWLQEMDKLLVGPCAARGLEVLLECRVLSVVLPEVAASVGFHETCPVHHKDIWAHTLGVLSQTPTDPVLRWAALLHDVGKVWTRTIERDEGERDEGERDEGERDEGERDEGEDTEDEADDVDTAEASAMGDDATGDESHGRVRFFGHEAVGAMLFEGIGPRFRFDKRSAARVAFLIAEHGLPAAYTSEWSDTAVRRLVRTAGKHLDDLLIFARADMTTRFEHKRNAARARLTELIARIRMLERADALRPKLPAGLGRAIMAELGLSQGPAVGRYIELVTEAVIQGRLPGSPTIEECLELLRGATTA